MLSQLKAGKPLKYEGLKTNNPIQVFGDFSPVFERSYAKNQFVSKRIKCQYLFGGRFLIFKFSFQIF